MSYQLPVTYHEAHPYHVRKRYDDDKAYWRVFDEIFGDRDQLEPWEFEQSQEKFDKLYKREVIRHKIYNFFGIYYSRAK